MRNKRLKHGLMLRANIIKNGVLIRLFRNRCIILKNIVRIYKTVYKSNSKIYSIKNKLKTIYTKTDKRIIFDNHMLYFYENIYDNKINLRKRLNLLYEVCEYEEQKIIVDNMDRSYSLQNFEDIKNIAQHAKIQSYPQKLISHKYKFVYLRNPKTGSSTIVDIIRQIDPDVITIHGDRQNIQHDVLIYTRNKIKDYYHFTSIRDPYARILSTYKDKILNANELKYKYYIEPYYGLYRNISFKDFCEWLNSVYGSDIFADKHWRSQYLNIYNFNIPFGYNLNYNYICKLENLHEDLHKIFIELNVDTEYTIKHINNTSDQYEDVIIDNTFKDMIYKRYEKDFEIFKYAK